MRANQSEKQFAEWLLQVEGTYDAESDSLPAESIILPSSHYHQRHCEGHCGTRSNPDTKKRCHIMNQSEKTS